MPAVQSPALDPWGFYGPGLRAQGPERRPLKMTGDSVGHEVRTISDRRTKACPWCPGLPRSVDGMS
jgi:hypothetical protein